jgi:hypothetical protein
VGTVVLVPAAVVIGLVLPKGLAHTVQQPVAMDGSVGFPTLENGTQGVRWKGVNDYVDVIGHDNPGM